MEKIIDICWTNMLGMKLQASTKMLSSDKTELLSIFDVMCILFLLSVYEFFQYPGLQNVAYNIRAARSPELTPPISSDEDL